MFVDSVKVTLRAGKGGNGVVAWRREKYIPKGGPSEATAAKEARSCFKTDSHVLSLEGFRNRRQIMQKMAIPAAPAKRAQWEDLVLDRPLRNARQRRCYKRDPLRLYR